MFPLNVSSPEKKGSPDQPKEGSESFSLAVTSPARHRKSSASIKGLSFPIIRSVTTKLLPNALQSPQHKEVLHEAESAPVVPEVASKGAKRLSKQQGRSNLFISKSKSIKQDLIKKMKSNNSIDSNEIREIIQKDTSFRLFVNDMDEPSGQTLLFLACSNGDISLVDVLLKVDGINVNGVQDITTSSTPLHAATWGGHVEIVAMLLASKAIPQYATINNILPEKEIENNPDLDKERKKRMEELWKAYNKKKKGIEMFLPSGKSLKDYKPQDTQLSLETIITGLTSEENHKIANALQFRVSDEQKTRINIKDFLLTQRLYCSPEECFGLLKKRFSATNDVEGEIDLKVKVLNIFRYWITDLWQEFLDESLRSKVETFLQSIIQNEKLLELESITKSLINSLKEVSTKSIPELIVPQNNLPVNTKVSITTFYPSSIVQNLNAIDTNLWKQVRPTQSWDLEQLLPAIKWERRLNRFVFSRIFDGQSIGQRVDYLNRFIDICDDLSNKENFTNFNSLIAILDALCNFQSTVLWKGVPLDKKNKFNEYTKLFEKNFLYCSEQIKIKISQLIPFIPPVAVYNFYGLRWMEKQNLTKENKVRAGQTPVTLRQLSNASQLFEAVLRVHNSDKIYITQPSVLDFLFSEVMTDQEKDNSLKELTSQRYLEKEWLKALQNNDTKTVGILLAQDSGFLVKKDLEGRTCIHHVTEANNEAMIKFLLNYDRKIELLLFEEDSPISIESFFFEEEKNKTHPISIASKNGYTNILSLFLSYYECFKKTSDTEFIPIQQELRLQYEQGNLPSTSAVWDIWISGGSKALESANYSTFSKTTKKFPWQKDSTKELDDLPQLDWNKFGSFQPLPTSAPISKPINLLISTEEQYLNELLTILRVIKPFTSTHSLTQNDTDTLFNGIFTLTFFHKNLLEEYLLLTNIDNYCLLFDAFNDKFEMIKTYYVVYSQGYGKMVKIIKKLKQSKYVKVPPNVPDSPWLYFTKPINRIIQYSDLLNNIYVHLPENEKKMYADLLLNFEELSQHIRLQFYKILSEKITSRLSTIDQAKILNNGKIVYKVGKYFDYSKSMYLTYLLQRDCLYCFAKKDIKTKGTRNLHIEEEYPICSVVKVVPFKDNQIKINLFPRGKIEIEILVRKFNPFLTYYITLG